MKNKYTKILAQEASQLCLKDEPLAEDIEEYTNTVFILDNIVTLSLFATACYIKYPFLNN
jgi:hypothetical protein